MLYSFFSFFPRESFRMPNFGLSSKSSRDIRHLVLHFLPMDHPALPFRQNQRMPLQHIVLFPFSRSFDCTGLSDTLAPCSFLSG